MNFKKKTLTEKFMIEISKIKSPEVFIGLAKVLKVQIMKDKENPYSFSEMFEDMMDKFDNLTRDQKKEILGVIKDANRAKNTKTK